MVIPTSSFRGGVPTPEATLQNAIVASLKVIRCVPRSAGKSGSAGSSTGTTTRETKARTTPQPASAQTLRDNRNQVRAYALTWSDDLGGWRYTSATSSEIVAKTSGCSR